MSQITLHNYEAFLLDYSEGILNAKDCEALKSFVVAHPELEIDLGDFDLPYLLKESDSVDFKSSLKKTEEDVPDEEVLNYFEGNLNTEQRIAFELKLEQNPDLANDLEAYKKTTLVADKNQVPEFKSTLHKTEDDLVLNNRLLAYLENQVPDSERKEIERELNASEELKKEFVSFSKTILAADLSIIHPDKEALKKENRVFVLFSFRTMGSMAAALLLLLGFALIYNYYGSKTKVDSGLATKTNPVKNHIEIPSVVKSSSTEIVPENKSLEKIIAKKTENTSLNKVIRKETPDNLIKKESPVITHVEAKEIEIKLNPIEDKKQVLASNSKAENLDSISNKQNYLVVIEENSDEEELMDTKEANQKGFWKKAVHLAKQANKLGVKSIDGQENSENKYRLSFNSFSVEKK